MSVTPAFDQYVLDAKTTPALNAAEKLFAARYQFDKTLADLQQLLIDIHIHGGKDVIAYREIGDSSEIYRERRD